MKNILVVSPHFPPVNSADSQRIRMSLPHYEKYGWKADILCVDPEHESGVKDNDLLKTVPGNINVYRAKAVSVGITGLAGVKGIQWRSLFGLYSKGTELLKKNGYDLVFFSSTVFPSFILGPVWKKKFGVPYIIDIQDPWLNDYDYKNPPGGKIKYYLSNLFARIFEPLVIKNCSHILFVSERYPDIYKNRYGIKDNSYNIIPFGYSEKDFGIADTFKFENRLFGSEKDKINWVYIGRAGEDYSSALDLFFSAVREEIDDGVSEWNNVNIHFIGTSYAEKGKGVETVKPFAEKYGLGEMVSEDTERIPFLETLGILKDSDVIMLFGSDDESYSPSKIYPYVYSGTPMFGLVNSESPGFEILNKLGCEFIVPFGRGKDRNQTVMLIRQKFKKLFQTIIDNKVQNSSEIKNYESSHLAKLQCELFNNCIGE